MNLPTTQIAHEIRKIHGLDESLHDNVLSTVRLLASGFPGVPPPGGDRRGTMLYDTPTAAIIASVTAFNFFDVSRTVLEAAAIALARKANVGKIMSAVRAGKSVTCHRQVAAHDGRLFTSCWFEVEGVQVAQSDVAHTPTVPPLSMRKLYDIAFSEMAIVTASARCDHVIRAFIGASEGDHESRQ